MASVGSLDPHLSNHLLFLANNQQKGDNGVALAPNAGGTKNPSGSPEVKQGDDVIISQLRPWHPIYHAVKMRGYGLK